MKLDESILLAYVDGNLDAERTRAVELALNEDPAAQEIVEKLRATPESLREVFDATLARPLPPQFSQTLLRNPTGLRSRIRLRHAATAAVLVFLVGAGTGYFSGRSLQGPTEFDGWIAAVVDYQVLYGRATLERPDAGPKEIQAAEQRLGEKLGTKVKVPDLHSFGLAFKRGQVLDFHGEPVAQLAYLPNVGRPIAYCITRTQEPDLLPVFGVSKGLSFYSWRDNGYGHIVVGIAKASDLKQLVTYIRGG